MKVFVSTKLGQGQRENDFCHVPEYELISLGSECDGEDVDGSCGCRRSVSGLLCHLSTTTFAVADLDITREQYINLIRQSLFEAGYGEDDFDLTKVAEEDAGELLRLAASYEVGDVCEKRGDYIQKRGQLDDKDIARYILTARASFAANPEYKP